MFNWRQSRCACATSAAPSWASTGTGSANVKARPTAAHEVLVTSGVIVIGVPRAGVGAYCASTLVLLSMIALMCGSIASMVICPG